MALVSDRITSDVIEVSEFPDLARRYQVSAVPKVIMNDQVQFTGALPESAFLDQVMAATRSPEQSV